MGIRVSVLVPIYNAEKYISQCLDSVLKQTLENIEIICVDDGSTDRSCMIVEDYVSKYPSVRLMKQENSGAAIARNRALSMAQGEFVCFLDADDYYIDIDALERLYNAAVKEHVLVSAGLVQIEKAGGIERNAVLRDLLRGRDLVHVLYKEFQHDYQFTCYLYNRHFLREREIVFPACRRFEDPPFLVRALYQAEDFVIVGTEFYFYRREYKKNIKSDPHVYDLLNGLGFNLAFASEHNLEILFRITIDRMNHEYFDVLYQGLEEKVSGLEECFENIEHLIHGTKYRFETLDLYRLKNKTDSLKYKLDYQKLEKKLIHGSNVIIYGAGDIGRKCYLYLRNTDYANVVMWVDHLKKGQMYYSMNLRDVEDIDRVEYDSILIAIMQTDISEEIKENLLSKGIDRTQIVEWCNEVKVSVVVPVYNTQIYLEECLDSILAQTLSEIEVICVDDGSTDRCPAILDAYAEKDHRIQVFHRTNGGYGKAVNFGMDHSVGKYISIVEPDDYIETEMLEVLYTAAEKYELDMVTADYKWFSGEGSKRIFQTKYIIDEGYFYNTVINPFEHRKVFCGGYINPAGLFRRNFLLQNSIRHNETPGASFQDCGFGFQVLAYARRVMLLPVAFYCYRQDNPNSSIKNGEKMIYAIKEYQYIYQVIKRNSDKLGSFVPEYTRKKVGSYLNMYNRLDSELRFDFLKLMREDIQESIDEGMFDMGGLSENHKWQIKLIMEDPETFYKRDDFLCEEVHQKIIDVSRVVIYGAGMFGKKIYDSMLVEDRQKVIGFAVTNLSNNAKQYVEVPVKQIDSYDRNVSVIVGVTSRYEQEVVSVLREKGWKNIICLDSQKWYENL